MYQAIPFFVPLRQRSAMASFNTTFFGVEVRHRHTQPGIWRMETRGGGLLHRTAWLYLAYTLLTGRMPMPPRWSLGYHQWSYDSRSGGTRTRQEFPDSSIPVMLIHLDIDYMPGYRVFTWSRRFPRGTIDRRSPANDGLKTVTIIDRRCEVPERKIIIFDQRG